MISCYNALMKGVMWTMKKILVFAVMVLCLCVSAVDAGVVLRDMQRYPQDPAAYVISPDAMVLTEVESAAHAVVYLEKRYRPWVSSDCAYLGVSMDKIAASLRGLSKKTLYGPDGRQVSTKILSNLGAECSRIDHRSTPRPGVALDAADMRLLPTDARYYSSPASALGKRGLLKQDELQNSTVKPGDPVAVWGVSKNGEWSFVASDSALGWVLSKKLAIVRPETIAAVPAMPHAVAVRDNAKISGRSVKLGTLLPMDAGTPLVPIRGLGGFAEYVRADDPKGVFAHFPVPFSQGNAARVAGELVGEPYGWGALGGLRDCSAMTRDYFAAFGVWLPRNSGDQASRGLLVPATGTKADRRESLLVERGVPFATLVHVPGHIMLYIGTKNGVPMLLHNMWGIRTNAPGEPESRAAVGRAVITTLRAGEEIKSRRPNSLFVDRMDVISIPTVLMEEKF